MKALPVSHVFAGIAVRDFAAAAGWYEQLLGRPPDMLPHATEAVWDLAGGGLVYIVGDAERAGGGQLMLMVPDLEEALDLVAERGLGPARTEVMDSGARKATLTDPDGNRVSLGQV